MAINKKLIHFQTMANFEAQLSAGNILDTSIVFIKDAKKIWTHGEFYDCSGYDDTEIKGQISEIEATIGDINTILESIISGGGYYGLAQYSDEELLNIVDEALEE